MCHITYVGTFGQVGLSKPQNQRKQLNLTELPPKLIARVSFGQFQAKKKPAMEGDDDEDPDGLYGTMCPSPVLPGQHAVQC